MTFYITINTIKVTLMPDWGESPEFGVFLKVWGIVKGNKLGSGKVRGWVKNEL